jgi:hypothetical protein
LLELDDDDDRCGARCAALEQIFGKAEDVIMHAVIPFEFGYDAGGRADIAQFSHVPGTLYSTCELMGRPEQIANALGAYELAICERSGAAWAARLISSLAYYTLEARLEPGQTMDIAPAIPQPSRITGLLFEDFGRFSFRGRPAGVLLAIGITKDELMACRRGQRDKVLKALKSKAVYPFTDIGRRSALSLF